MSDKAQVQWKITIKVWMEKRAIEKAKEKINFNIHKVELNVYNKKWSSMQGKRKVFNLIGFGVN